ncbi:MAG: hypothetical protein ACI9JO_001468, partial [Psychrobacter okhotskensis]
MLVKAGESTMINFKNSSTNETEINPASFEQ